MEKVAFLLESGEQIRCLLNPESLLFQRRSGVQSRETIGRTVSGVALSDDQIVYTGGGRTEVTMNLLFDVTLAEGSTITSQDVRDLTSPIWNLSENQYPENNRTQLPVCRFIWGKSWNIPVVVIAVSENLDSFSDAGVPRRSWLRIRLRRISEEIIPATTAFSTSRPALTTPASTSASPRTSLGVTGAEVSGERLDQMAHQHYGDSSLWREIATYNDLADPALIGEGNVIDLPPLSDLLERSTT